LQQRWHPGGAGRHARLASGKETGDRKKRQQGVKSILQQFTAGRSILSENSVPCGSSCPFPGHQAESSRNDAFRFIGGRSRGRGPSPPQRPLEPTDQESPEHVIPIPHGERDTPSPSLFRRLPRKEPVKKSRLCPLLSDTGLCRTACK